VTFDPQLCINHRPPPPHPHTPLSRHQHAQEEISKKPVDVVKVPYAAKWTGRSFNAAGQGGAPGSSNAAAAVGGEAPLEISTHISYDWTFSSDYCCSLLDTAGSHVEDSEQASFPATAQSLQGESQPEQLSFERGSVLRATSLHGLSPVRCRDAQLQSVEASQPPSAIRDQMLSGDGATTATDEGGWQVEPRDASGIDYELLKRRDEPILFFDEFILYKVRERPPCTG
jgi:hypothetical protein